MRIGLNGVGVNSQALLGDSKRDENPCSAALLGPVQRSTLNDGVNACFKKSGIEWLKAS